MTLTQALALYRLDVQNKAVGTQRWHKVCLGKFRGWAESHGHTDLPSIDKWVIRQYWAYLREEGLAVKTFGSSLRAFYNFLQSEELISTNPVAQVGIPKTARPRIKAMLPDEVAQLLKGASTGRNSWRDRSLILLLFDTGLRIHEALSVTLSDLDDKHNRLYIMGKGGKPRVVIYSYRIARHINTYLIKERRPASPDIHELFLTERGEHMNRFNARDMLKRAAQRGGVPSERVGLHKLRHSFAVDFLRNGANALELKKALGHSTLTMTDRYVELFTADLEKAHMRASPVNRLLGKKRLD